MKYKLIREQDPKLNTIQQILVNRGILASETDHYLHTNEKDLHSPFLLKHMEAAVMLEQCGIYNSRIEHHHKGSDHDIDKCNPLIACCGTLC